MTRPAGSGPRLSATLWLAFAVFIVYGGTIPFHFTSNSRFIVRKLSRVTLNPLVSHNTGRRVPIPDVVQNVLLFLPFGFLGFLALEARWRSSTARVLLVTALAALLSTAVETLQLFTIDRTTSVADVVANMTGGFGGALVAPAVAGAWQKWVGRREVLRLVEPPAFYPLMIITLVLCVAAWEPFDVTLELGSLGHKARAWITDPWKFVSVHDEGIEFVRYALFTIIASLWLRQLGIRAAAILAATAGTAIAVVLEASQFFVQSRMPGLEDATVHAGGAIVGALLSPGWPYGRSGAFWCALVGIATWVGAALQMLSPTGVDYYARISPDTVSHVIELMLVYFPLGFAFPLVFRERRHIWWVSIAAALAIVVPLGAMQGWIVGRYPAVTDVDVVIAVLGALLGTWAAGSGPR